MKFSSYNNKVERSSLKVEKTKSNKTVKFFHPLLRPFISFWRFSCYYAEYKARSRGW